METLKEAQEHIAKNIYRGVDCPCCGQAVKITKLYFHKEMVDSLFWIYFANQNKYWPGDYVDVPETLKKLGVENKYYYSKLAYWNLIEQHESDRGMFRVTETGIQFLKGNKSLENQALVFNGQVMMLAGREVEVAKLVSGFSLARKMNDNIEKINLL